MMILLLIEDVVCMTAAVIEATVDTEEEMQTMVLHRMMHVVVQDAGMPWRTIGAMIVVMIVVMTAVMIVVMTAVMTAAVVAVAAAAAAAAVAAADGVEQAVVMRKRSGTTAVGVG